MARPVDPKYPVNQRFGGYATRGVVGRPNGSEIEYLVWLYGDYQHFGHAGADIACPIGTPVYAMLDGVVVYDGWGEDLPGDDSWGPFGYFRRWGLYKNFPGIVKVVHHPQNGKCSIYGHLSDSGPAPTGTQVKAGQLIGYSGNTKTRRETVGPHLHVAMLADTVNYRTGGGLIFGCEDPVPYFASAGEVGTIQVQAASTITPITPITEVDDMTPDQLLNFEFELKSGAKTTMLTQFQNMDENNRAMLAQQQASQRYAEAVNGKIDELAQALPESTLDEQITMPDGRVTTPRQEIAWLAANFEALQTNIQVGK